MKISTLSAAMLSMLMAGCGGSGSGSDNKNTSSALSLSSTTASANSIASTESSAQQTSSPAPVMSGVFLDAAVANMGYRTATQEGFTNQNGEFRFRIGELITFFIGDLELPATIAKDIITPLEIANVESLEDNQVINILRLLQSLDADGDASNGIEITAAAIAAGTVLDFAVAPDVFAELPAVKTLLQVAGGAQQALIPAAQAVAHFQTTLALINETSSSSSSQLSSIVVEVSSSAANSEAIAPSSSSASSEIIVAASSVSVSSVAVVESSSAVASSELALSSLSVSSAVIDDAASSAVASSEPALSSAAMSSIAAVSSSSVDYPAEVFFTETFDGATESNFYSTYRLNNNGQSVYKKSGGTPAFNDGVVTLTGARFTIGEAGKDLDLSRPYTISFDVIQASGSGKVQIFVDSASTSGTRIFNENASTLTNGQRFVLSSATGTATSFIQIRAESSATLIFDNLTIEYSGGAGSSSSVSSTVNTGTSSSVVSTTSSAGTVVSSSSQASSSAPYIPVDVNLSAECISLVTNPSVNWRDTSLQTDQEIVECLYESLGRPVGYGENAQGGYNPDGNSKLTIITKNGVDSVEQQLIDALTDNAHNWVVFDKTEFASEYEIGMYRMYCANPTVLSMLDASETECIDYWQWCARKGFSDEAQCRTEFFNKAMNNKNIPIRIPAIGSNKTIDGRMSKAYFMFSGFAIGKDSDGVPTQTSTSVIFTHLDFRGAGHTEDHYVDPDMIRSTGFSSDIWIHKNTFDTTGDSAFDVKIGAHNITMSFNRLVNVKRAVLHGSSDSRTINEHITTTMHHNAFVTTDDSYKLLGNTLRRVPLLRRGKTHMFNNLFVNYRKEVLSARVGSSVFLEDNVFTTNIILKEKSNLDAALNEILDNLIQSKAITGSSNLRNDRNFFWFGSGTCVLDETTKRQLTLNVGTVANLSQNYNAASLNMISGWRFAAEQALVDYVTLTAGKNGDTPFNSPLSADRAYMEALSPVSCQ